MMVKGTYKKRQFSENGYLLVFEPTTRAEEIVSGLIAILEGTTENLVIRQRIYNGVTTITKSVIKFTHENITISYEYSYSNKKSDIVSYMEQFDKTLKMNWRYRQCLPVRYCSNLHRGGQENGSKVDSRLLITRTV